MKLSSLLAQSPLEAGREFELADGLFFSIRPAYSKEFDDTVRTLTLRGSDGGKRPVMSDAEVAEIQLQAHAATVLVGWRGLQDDNGNPLPYSRERALELLRGNYRFYRWVQVSANNMATQAFAFMEAAEGKFEPLSNGN
jgi:hypothetical protein